MDDYNTSVLSEAKNEYSANLVNILTPLIIQGLQSIFKEACGLCQSNDEDNKYLMTFQNFLTRVPKWNQNIIQDETNRILEKSKCSYLEDLLTCVYITQLKILTSIRVSSKQKKIDIDIPKLSEFIHKVYIASARKIYSNVYLFEEATLPLQKQKNMRECELICKECLLNVIRESMPVEKILRAYLDETTEEEVIEEKVTEIVDSKKEEIEKLAAIAVDNKVIDTATSDITTNTSTIKKDLTTTENKILKELNADIKNDPSIATPIETLITTSIETPIATPTQQPFVTPTQQPFTTPTQQPFATPTPPSPSLKPSNISFNDNDQVMNYNKVQSPKSIKKKTFDTILAPKTIDRLEEISKSRHEQRKLEEEEEEDEDKLTIHSEAPSLLLDELDINDIDDKIKLEKTVLHDVISLN